ncbi:centromere protein X [Ixodes scapularis]|uniref:centromere protein X n=1 Tax=Ixodes scapularis TaxID=6945 RepID=UPI001A9FDC4A|nr:centromere protein X [Ixodes scapularis]
MADDADAKAGSSMDRHKEIGVKMTEEEAVKDIEPLYDTPTFKTKTIQELMLMGFQDEKTKMNAQALKLTCEILRLLAHEGAARAAMQAKLQGDREVTLEHLEKILPQLMLDFP